MTRKEKEKQRGQSILWVVEGTFDQGGGRGNQ